MRESYAVIVAGGGHNGLPLIFPRSPEHVEGSMSKGGEGEGEGALKTGHIKHSFGVIVGGDGRTAAQGICGALLAPPRHFELLKFSKFDMVGILREGGRH